MKRWVMPLADIRWCTVDAIEVSPVRHLHGEDAVEVCAPHDAHFWSVYTNFRRGGVECVADFDLESEAWHYAEVVLAGPRGLPTYSGAA